MATKQTAPSLSAQEKQVTEIIVNKDGQRVRVTKTLKLVPKAIKIPQGVVRRRALPKFGDCAGIANGVCELNVTTHVPDSINLELSIKKREDVKEDDPLAKLSAAGGQSSLARCRNCGEAGHFTLKCPKRSELQPVGIPSPAPAAEPSSTSSTAAAAAKYVPRHLRDGRAQTTSSSTTEKKYGDDLPTIKVSNLSEDTTDEDLMYLFTKFGRVLRRRMLRDRVTNRPTGIAFISYTTTSECQKAIDKLNGFGFENLILRVDWATPRREE